MRKLRKLVLTGFAWLTAFTTSAAALPHWQCCCADAADRPADLRVGLSCRCDQPPARKAGAAKACCHGKQARRTPPRRWQGTSDKSHCSRTLAHQAAYTADRTDRLSVTADAVPWAVTAFVLPHDGSGELPATAEGRLRPPAPPPDRVLLFEHFII